MFTTPSQPLTSSQIGIAHAGKTGHGSSPSTQPPGSPEPGSQVSSPSQNWVLSQFSSSAWLSQWPMPAPSSTQIVSVQATPSMSSSGSHGTSAAAAGAQPSVPCTGASGSQNSGPSQNSVS